MTRKSLAIGTELDRYVIKDMLAEDGRGISYLAVDTSSVSGSAKVLIREYFPRGISVRTGDEIGPRDRQEAQDEFERGLLGFIEAGKTLVGLKTHTLVPALDIVEENSTAYLVLEEPKGRLFAEYVTGEETMSAELLRSQLAILLPGLHELHTAGLLHTGLTPETLIRLDDGYPAISQLTHVERFDGEGVNRTHLLVDTPYAAPELRSDSDAPIGPWTDIYSLAGACWFLLTGDAPATAAARLASIGSGRGDPIVPGTIIELGEGNEQLAAALVAGLELLPERRLASAADFMAALKAGPAWPGAAILAPAANFASTHKVPLLAAAAALTVGLFAVGLSGPAPQGAQDETLAEANNMIEPAAVEVVDNQIDAGVIKATAEEPKMLANAAWLLVDRDDPEDVRGFMETYADVPVMSVMAAERLELLDERAWSAALAVGTIEAFEGYLTNFSSEMSPPGVHVDEASAKLADMMSAQEFRIAEARRLLTALGYKAGKGRSESPALTRSITRFQNAMDIEADGLTTDALLDIMSAEVVRRDEEAKKAEAEAERLKARAEAEERYVALVREAATSEDGTASGEIELDALKSAVPEKAGDEGELITPPVEEAEVIFETKVATSTIAVPKTEIIEVQTEPEPAPEPVRSAGERFADCPTCPQLTVIPAGSFKMGSPYSERDRLKTEGPVHSVTIPYKFAIGTYEVTRREYADFVKATGHKVASSCAAETAEHKGEWIDTPGLTFRKPGFGQTGDHPVVCVSWKDAKAYTNWLTETTGKTYRLASEAEWEYAARAGSKSTRHFGRTYRNGCSYANGADRTAKNVREHWITASCNDGHLATASVGTFKSNAFGLFDMIGNVWEWTEDCYASDYSSAPVNGSAYESGSCKSKVTRGGSWASGENMLRSAARSGDSPNARYDMVGFRIVRELDK